jgi:hypothetical protein
MASGTLLRSIPEGHLNGFVLLAARPVAIDASQRSMCAFQGKSCGLVVEPLQLTPGLENVTTRAGLRFLFRHRRRTATMRIPMAAFAIEIVKVETPFVAGVFPMALQTGHGRVRAAEGEARGLMPRDIESGRAEGARSVAVLTAVVKGSSRELASVRIAVAIHAGAESGMVIRGQPLWCVTPGTSHVCMFARQGETRGVMIGCLVC